MATLLIVEDNEMNLDMLSRRLQRRGYEIITAMDGEKAIQLAIENTPDLILMDMGLPIIDGWEATEKIKQHQATAHIPIIALTAHVMEGERQQAMIAGCDDYDTKPIEIKRLLSKIETLLSG